MNDIQEEVDSISAEAAAIGFISVYTGMDSDSFRLVFIYHHSFGWDAMLVTVSPNRHILYKVEYDEVLEDIKLSTFERQAVTTFGVSDLPYIRR